MRKLTTGTFGIECKSVLPIRIMRGVHMRMIVKTISDKGMSYIYYMLCYYLYVIIGKKLRNKFNIVFVVYEEDNS